LLQRRRERLHKIGTGVDRHQVKADVVLLRLNAGEKQRPADAISFRGRAQLIVAGIVHLHEQVLRVFVEQGTQRRKGGGKRVALRHARDCIRRKCNHEDTKTRRRFLPVFVSSWRVVSGYSASAMIGSMRVARRAGSAHARMATMASMSVTVTSTIGSPALTPYNWLSRLLRSATAPAAPS